MNNHVMSFDEFRGFLSDALGISESLLVPETHFLGDLAIESLKMVELVLQMEKQMGRKISSDAAWEIETVQDAYEFYRGQLQTTR